MLSLSLPLDIFLCIEPTDMRCGFDRLAQRALEHAARDVLAGGLFVFVNRRRDRIKLLYWDGDGFCVFGSSGWRRARFRCRRSRPTRTASR